MLGSVVHTSNVISVVATHPSSPGTTQLWHPRWVSCSSIASQPPMLKKKKVSKKKKMRKDDVDIIFEIFLVSLL
jgi:hypothetical protein